MARSRHRLTKAITLKTIKPTLAWSQGAAYAFDFPANAARFTDRPAGNLLTSPEDFSAAAWTKLGASVAANAIAAPDGTLTADLLVEDTSTGTHITLQTATVTISTAYTLTLFVKGGGRNWVQLLENGGSSSNAYFNLSAGTVGTVTGVGAVASIEALSGGWYRCRLTFTTGGAQVAANTQARIATADTVNSYTGDGTSGIYVWGARLEAGSVAADYLTREARYYALASVPGWTFSRASTGYALNNAGQLVSFASGAPRITDRGFLAEGARTNLLLQSQTFNTTWSLTNVTVTSDAIAAPDGTLTADKLEVNGASPNVVQNAVVAATTATYSIYVKKGSGATDANRFLLRNNTTSTNLVGITFNYDTAAITYTTGSSGASVEALADGWYRLALSTSSGITSGDTIRCYPGFTGSSDSIGEFAYFWGAQLEAAAFPSSYIPTTTASVTRAADSLRISSVTGLTFPETLFAEFERVVDTGTTETLVQIDAGSNNDRHVLRINSSDQAQHDIGSGGVSQSSMSVTGALALNTIYRAASRCETNNANIARGGTISGGDDTSVTVPATPTDIRFGNDTGSSLAAFNYIRKVAIFARALTNAELQAITAP